MKIEHVALNLEDPVSALKWYSENLEMQVLKSSDTPPYGSFIADKEGNVVLEIYANTTIPLPDYAAMHPLTFHLAFSVEDVSSTRERLLSKGATAEGEVMQKENGDTFAMLRDPWGVPIQLVNRANALL